MSNQLISHWLLAMINEWSMSNRSPKILCPINYSSMTSITHWCNWLLIDDPSIAHRLLHCMRKTLSLLSCTIFFRLWFFYLCYTQFFLYLKFLLTMSRSKVLITNADDSQLCNISLYPTLYLRTKQVNSNQPIWKWNQQVHGQESTTWLSIFFLWVFVSKVECLRLRETSVISSYITSLSIEYLNKFRFFGLWTKRDSSIF